MTKQCRRCASVRTRRGPVLAGMVRAAGAIACMAVLAGTAWAQATAPAAPAAPSTQAASGAVTTETLRVGGLQAAVESRRDRWGINHIYAANEHDLFFAQGYAAARDRLFQFEIWRRQATGTVAEVLGRRELARDVGTRLHMFRGDLTAELNWYHPRGAQIITAFVDGINAYVDEALQRPDQLPIEFRMLGLTPGRWTPAVVISRHNGLLANLTQEISTARAVAAIGADAVKAVSGFQGPDPVLTLDPAIDPAVLTPDVLDVYNAFREPLRFLPQDVLPQYRVPQAVARLDEAVVRPSPQDLSQRREDIGSNNWVVSGRLTQSGLPLLMNDPHRLQGVPSLRYWSQLVAPGWDVIGGGEPMLPGVSIGHNAHGAWGLTIFGIDTEGLYVYELAAGDPTRYRYRGQWLAMTTETDTVRVRGGAATAVTLRYTRHGPVLYADSTRRVAVAVRAAWLEPGGAPYLASLRLDQARSWTEARAALAYARMPVLNWIWADTSGTIGWQAAGIAPRRVGWDGLTPVPGDGRYEWAGFLPIPQLPTVTNPAHGYVGTANAYNVDPAYPHHDALARSWAEPWRHNRLHEVLDTTRRADVASMAALQHDEVPLAARALVPLLRGVRLADRAVAAARDTLLAWDGVLRADSRGGALYAAWERQLLTRTAERALPGPVRAPLRTVALSRTVQWLTAADTVLGWDPVPVRDSLVRQAFEAAVADLGRRFGRDIGGWRYGDARFHHARIAHVFDPLVSDSLRPWLSPGPLPRGGYANTLNATGNGDNQTSGPSLRVVIDLADWDRAIASNTPGQSGDPRSPWYANLFPLWAANRYVPLPYSPAAVAARAAVVDTLRP